MASPTIPTSAISKIGASSSLLMAMIYPDPIIPDTCCVAPDTPQAIYNFGATILPD